MLFQINSYGVKSEETTNSNRIYPLEGYERYNYSSKINIGTLKGLSLPHSFRLCYDNFLEYMTDGGKGLYKKDKATISSNAAEKTPYAGEPGQDRVIGSVGRWYAGYALPATTVAIDKSLKLSDTQAVQAITRKDKSIVLSNGYIIVSFDIKTKDKNKVDYLKYYGPEARFLTTADLGEEVPGKDIPEIIWNPKESPSLKITLPNGKPAIVPTSSVSLFESDTSVQIDTRSDIIY